MALPAEQLGLGTSAAMGWLAACAGLGVVCAVVRLFGPAA